MSDSVVRETVMRPILDGARMRSVEVTFTKLEHDGDKVGPFERWMVDWLEECAFEDREAYGETGDQQRWGRIAAAISRLFEEVGDG